MPRTPRIYLPDASVHVIQRGNNRTAIFRDQQDYEWFLMILQTATAKHGVSVHGFVLMTTHYHVMATPRDERSLPRAMKEIGVRYVQYFNRRHDRVGTLWTGRYRAILITDERYWLTCLRYIEQNPVRAQMVAAPEGYRWSSYSVHGLGNPPCWLSLHQVYLSLGSNAKERQAAYRALCGTHITDSELVQQRFGRLGLGVRPGSDPGLTP
jgi:putative transposase